MTRAIVLALLLTVGATAAAAQPGPGGGRPPRLFISPAGEPFHGLNGLQTWFARADADHDGKITPAEFQADALRFFERLDANHDGRLDGFELQAYERDIVPEITDLGGPMLLQTGDRRGAGPRGGGKHGRGGGLGGGREGAGRFGLLNIPEPVTGADLDVDGRVTLDEWKKATAARFPLLDVTKAGVFSLETLPPLPGAAPPPKGR